LTYLTIANNQVNADQITEIKKALPNCHIDYYPLVSEWETIAAE